MRIVIMGGTAGIGLACAQQLTASGAEVIAQRLERRRRKSNHQGGDRDEQQNRG